jgi:hypothetical protein
VARRRLRQRLKLILSRKGLDTSSGGVPSPIFPDGTMMSLPIPDKKSAIAYEEIVGNRNASVGELVQCLAKIPRTHRAHLDPDLWPHSIERSPGWHPLFGQVDAAESHLQNQGVGTGDVFLFFGLFREVERSVDGWSYVRGTRPKHVVFGWLQIGRRVAVSNWPADARWALYHPHFRREPHPTNVVYVAADRLAVPGFEPRTTPGAGLFPRFTRQLQLTETACSRPCRWVLPKWFHPTGRASVLSYHRDLTRWQASDAGAMLDSVSRSQEFVLDCADYPEAINWIREILMLTSYEHLAE